MSEIDADVTALALEAAECAARGERSSAAGLLEHARLVTRQRARRERQVVELVGAIVDGRTAHAAGLAAEHRAEFPCDGVLLDELFRAGSGSGRHW